MPSTFREKLIAAVGFGAVLILVGLAFATGKNGEATRTAANPPPPRTTEPPPATTAPSPTTTPPPPAATTTTTPPPAPTTTTTGRQPQPGDARLVVTATRGASEVLVRAESVDGATLYEGDLAQGRSVRVFAPRLWISLSAAENVDLTLDSRPVERLPAGPLALVATPGRLQVAG